MDTELNISSRKKTAIFLTLIVAIFITSMSTTVTGNMIPNFTAYFNISANLAQWLTSGATLISGIIIPVTAFLIKRLLNKKYFFIAMTAYTLGSLASTLTVLIYILAGSDLIAVHVVYTYYGVVTAVILVSVFLYLRSCKKEKVEN